MDRGEGRWSWSHLHTEREGEEERRQKKLCFWQHRCSATIIEKNYFRLALTKLFLMYSYIEGCRKGILHDTVSCPPSIIFSDLLRYVLHGFPQFIASFFCGSMLCRGAWSGFCFDISLFVWQDSCMLYCHFLVCGLVKGDFYFTGCDVKKKISHELWR